MEIEELHQIENERTEEISDIIERMPINFGFWITLIVGFLLLSCGVFGWFIKYPDIITGQITISANSAPVRLIATYSGKLQIEHKSFEIIKTGVTIGYLKNPTNVNDINYLKSCLEKINYNQPQNVLEQLKAKELALGELNDLYYRFLNNLQSYYNYNTGNVMSEKLRSLIKLRQNQTEMEKSLKGQLVLGKQNTELQKNLFHRDSILFIQKVSTLAEFERSKINMLTVEQNFRSSQRELITIRESLNSTNSQIQQVEIENSDKHNQVKLDVISSLNNLKENIKAWEQKYCFISPIDGTVQFSKFWKNDQFVTPGEELFTIVPNNNKPMGELQMPSNGAGKVKIGQDVVIKLSNYPFLEYGTITGKVAKISMVSKAEKSTEAGVIDTYLVLVDLPNNLKTNYGSTLDFKFELKGTAEIITTEKRLIERLFDNIKYIHKN